MTTESPGPGGPDGQPTIVVGGPGPIVYRTARPYDIPALIELGAGFHAESRFRALPYDRTMVRTRFEEALAHPERYFAAVADEEGVPVALLAGYLTELHFTPVRVAMDACFYVRPDRRGTPAARRLLALFETFAGEHGASFVLLGVTSGIADDRTGRLLRHLGYGTMGANYGKKVQGSPHQAPVEG